MIKIAVTGPESTGKTTLSAALAKHYNTVYVPEYARIYLEKNGPAYTYNDVEEIALGQIKSEEEITAQAIDLLISDTELIVIKIWMEHKFGKIPGWLERRISDSSYDLYLLCDIDLPWELDPLREHPQLREYFFKVYKNELERRNYPFRIISGESDERLNSAIKEINKLL
jgi:NadR type nicotinamide-nucleotide adenylyltransferase